MAPLGATEYCCLAEEVRMQKNFARCNPGEPPVVGNQELTNNNKPPLHGAPRKEGGGPICRPQKIGTEGLQRAASDGAALSSEMARISLNGNGNNLEVEQAQCECCGLCEECTPAYIGRVRELFCGRWICGLCAEAVKEERHRMGRGTAMEEALQAHMSVCVKFNKIGRTNPAVHLADAMRQILKKRVEGSTPHGLRSKSSINSRLRQVSTASLARSSSCIPAISRD